MDARRMTPEEHKQGWGVLGCGIHVWTWRGAIVTALPDGAIEFCEEIGGPAIKREVLDNEYALAVTKGVNAPTARHMDGSTER